MNASPPIELIVARDDTTVSTDMDDSLGLHSCSCDSQSTQPSLLESRWDGDASAAQLEHFPDCVLKAPKRKGSLEESVGALRKPSSGSSTDVALKVPMRKATNESIDVRSDIIFIPQPSERLQRPIKPVRRVKTDPDRPKPLRIPRRLRKSMPASTTMIKHVVADPPPVKAAATTRPKRESLLDETSHLRQALSMSLAMTETIPLADTSNKRTLDATEHQRRISACDSTRTQRVDNRRRHCCSAEESHFSLDCCKPYHNTTNNTTVSVSLKSLVATDLFSGSMDDSSMPSLSQAEESCEGSSSSLLVGTLILKAMDQELGLDFSNSCRASVTSIGTEVQAADHRPKLPGRTSSRET